MSEWVSEWMNEGKNEGINQSIKSSICKAPIKQSSQRRLLWVGLHKEPSLKARLELLAINTTVLEMRWQHVANLGCHDAETAQTITRGPSTWYNHVIVVSRAKPGMKGYRDDWWTDVAGRKEGRNELRIIDDILMRIDFLLYIASENASFSSSDHICI